MWRPPMTRTIHRRRDGQPGGPPGCAPSGTCPRRAARRRESFVGEHLTIIEVHDWSLPGPDGSRESALDMHVKGAPLTLKGTLRLEPSRGGTVQVMDAELKANVPFIGGKIERAAADPIQGAIEIETGCCGSGSPADPTDPGPWPAHVAGQPMWG